MILRETYEPFAIRLLTLVICATALAVVPIVPHQGLDEQAAGI